ncbi:MULTISPECIES: hypothetical protein [Symbiopectobacterium]|uniref:hypothetical protein n=1 Tax=Symbiopectobacterium TaxID=801 RepID=UPI001A2A4EE1|nr:MULTISPECIES: hypothetical protein [Symbiopectobacterium]MBG6248364.1 hypothetical protein [Candidatus Symbiopectobacterium sp. PLON1]MBT9430275.1 hypothetical protein [Candidatus Symbiopectobacterium endolongispinus]
MSNEMKHAKIAYIIPFQHVVAEKGREPVLLINAQKEKGVSFELSMFFVGLVPDVTYTVYYSIGLDDDSQKYPQYVAKKKFKVSNVAGIEGLSPATFEVPIDLQSPFFGGQYRLEATLFGGDETSSETRRAVAFVDIRIKE